MNKKKNLSKKKLQTLKKQDSSKKKLLTKKIGSGSKRKKKEEGKKSSIHEKIIRKVENPNYQKSFLKRVVNRFLGKPIEPSHIEKTITVIRRAKTPSPPNPNTLNTIYFGPIAKDKNYSIEQRIPRPLMIFPGLNNISLATYCDFSKQQALEETEKRIQEEGREVCRELNKRYDGERGVQYLRDRNGNELPFLNDPTIRERFRDKTYGEEAEQFLVPFERIELERTKLPTSQKEREKVLRKIEKRHKDANRMARQNSIDSLRKRDEYIKNICTAEGIPGKVCASGLYWPKYVEHRDAGLLSHLYNPQNEFRTNHRLLSGTDPNDISLRRSLQRSNV